MTIQLIQGQFTPSEAIEIITQMINVKIKYHENKIAANSKEEDIKRRETKIKQLQKELFEARQEIFSKKQTLSIDATIKVTLQS